MPGALSQFATQVPFNQVAHVSGGQARAQQRMQLAERGFTGHAAARQHASPAQAATGFVHVQLNSAFVALGDGDHDDAVFVCLLQACEERRVVAGAGAAAVALQYQGLDPLLSRASSWAAPMPGTSGNTPTLASCLECFGSGTGPSDNPDFLASLQRAQENGIVVVAITQ